MSTVIINRCLNCIHYAGTPHPNKTDVCKNLGTREYAKAPRCFNITFEPLVRANVDVNALGKQLRHLQPCHLNLLGYVLAQSAELLEEGFKFGQKVFINMGVGKYLKNYYPAYIVGLKHATIKGEAIKQLVLSFTDNVMFSTEPERRTMLLVQISDDMQVYSAKAFKEIKEWCIKEDRIEIPERRKEKMTLAAWLATKDRPEPVDNPIDYIPPTIDDDFDEDDLAKINEAMEAKEGVVTELTLVATDDIQGLLTKQTAAPKPKAHKLKTRIDIVKGEGGNYTVGGTAKQKTSYTAALPDIQIRAF